MAIFAHRQVSCDGRVELVIGVGSKEASHMELSGGRGLGPEGALRLAGLLHEAPFLTSLGLRRRPLQLPPSFTWDTLAAYTLSRPCFHILSFFFVIFSSRSGLERE